MPADAFEDTLDLDIELLEAELPTSSSDPSYPYPRLSRTRRIEPRTFRALVLENSMLRATVLPDLGGRLWSIFDKRTGTEVLPQTPELEETGPRGVRLLGGLQAETFVGHGLSDMGPTLWALEAGDDVAAIWIGDACEGTGLSRHVRYELAADRPEITIELKTLNRGYSPASYCGGFSMYLAGGEATREGNLITYFSEDRKAGMWIDPGETILDGAGLDSSLVLARFASGEKALSPRQLDTLSVRIVPFSGIASAAAAGAEAAIGLNEKGIQIQAHQPLAAHKLVILTAAGETLETRVDLYPERILEIPAASLPESVTELALLSPTGKEILRVGDGPPMRVGLPPVLSKPRTETNDLHEELRHEDLLRMAFDVSTRHAAYLLLAREALTQREFARAEGYLEQALLYNGDDHLAWWTKAVSARLREGPTEERPELLNAHYLAPLEPALRAEAFLAQDPQMSKDPNPLLKAFEDAPETFVEVAAILTDLGLNDQATRWIDESLRHVDLAMLRYLQAFCYLRASRMHVEAAECVAAAGRLGLTPPLPWRPIEWQALSALHARFPHDEALARYITLRP